MRFDINPQNQQCFIDTIFLNDLILFRLINSNNSIGHTWKKDMCKPPSLVDIN